MFTRHLGLISGPSLSTLGVVLVLLCPSTTRADHAAQEAALKKHGLEKAGDYYLIAADAQARTQVEDARKASRTWRMAEMKKASTASVQDFQNYMKQLTDQVTLYRNEINAANAQINSAGRGARRGYTNNMVAEARAEMTVYRNQLQYEMNQLNQTITQLKQNPVKPEDKARAESEARDLRDAFEKAVKDARESVDSVTKKYEELASNPEVKQVLEQLGVGSKSKPKLGPSRLFVTQVKNLEKLEREIDGPTAAPTTTKHKRPVAGKSLKKSRGITKPSGDEAKP